MAEAKRYYIVQNGIQQGPMGVQVLLSYSFNAPYIDVWTAGLSDWQRVRSKSELQQVIGYQEPVLTTSSPYSPVSPLYSQGDPVLAAGYRYGNIGKRFLVEFIDSILFMFLLAALQQIGHPFLTYLVCVAIYGAVCYHYLGGTLGHYMLGLKVVSSTTAEDYKTPLKAAGRELAKSFCIWTILPALWVIFDQRGQNTYDKICDTAVVDKIRTDATYSI